jgi:hypothetical protein
MSAEIDENARRCWESKDDDSQMRCYLGMKGRVTLGELVEHFAEKYPHVDPMMLNLNYCTATWSEPPNADDVALRERNRAWTAERRDRWEADMYVKLKAKFEPSVAAVPVPEEQP